jgi:hypothetical protein
MRLQGDKNESSVQNAGFSLAHTPIGIRRSSPYIHLLIQSTSRLKRIKHPVRSTIHKAYTSLYFSELITSIVSISIAWDLIPIELHITSKVRHYSYRKKYKFSMCKSL